MESQAALLTLLLRKAKVRSGLHWRRQWRHVTMLVSPFWKTMLVFLPNSCRTRRNAVRCWNNKSDQTASRFCLGSKCHVVGHDLTSLWILHDWGFTRSEFHRSATQRLCFMRESARNIIASGGEVGRCDLLWGKLRWALMNSVASSGTRGSGPRCSERWRWDKQCWSSQQTPSESWQRVDHPGETRPVDLLRWYVSLRQTGWLASEHRVQLAWLSGTALL